MEASDPAGYYNCKENPAHRKQLEHFARTFQKTVREHGLVERGRFSTAKAYRDRAATWTQSSTEEEPPGPAGVRTPVSSSSSTETRRVYPAHFSDTYMSLVPPTSGGPYGREGLLASLADISTWIDHCARHRASRQGEPPDEETRNEIWLDNKSCSDVLRLLLIDAATTNDEPQRKKSLSTLLLLANHPGVGRLHGFMRDGMPCCHFPAGMSALVEKTTSAFIYLNLLITLVDDDQDARLLRPCDSLEDYGPTSRHGQGSITRLLPRPAYMNTRSFVKMLEKLLDEHCHAVEHVFFNPLYAPRPSGRLSKWLIRPDADLSPAPNYRIDRSEEARFERDVLADGQSLGDALKSMWRVLIFCDMVFREADRPLNWERIGLDAIRGLFVGSVDKLVGQVWVRYEMEREEEGGFAFYENEGGDSEESD
jgi:hypothetical protein